MRIIETEDYQEMSRKAAEILAAQVIAKPDSVLGLATGSTPVGAYQQLIRWCREGILDFSQVKTVNLDEYKGLKPDNDQSYRYFMNQNLFSGVNIRPENTHVPDGAEEDSEKACRDYDRVIEEAGGIDLQLLGIGHDGHIGFNEPSGYFSKGTSCVTLAERTIEANKRFFNSADEVPRKAYTMGIGSIMGAEKILIVISGEDKAEITAKAFGGPVTPEVPASILQFHPNVTLVADKAALSKWKESGQ